MNQDERFFYAERFQTLYNFISRVIAVNIIMLLTVAFFSVIPISEDVRTMLGIFYYLAMMFQIGYLHHIHKYTQNYAHYLLTGRDLYDE